MPGIDPTKECSLETRINDALNAEPQVPSVNEALDAYQEHVSETPYGSFRKFAKTYKEHLKAGGRGIAMMLASLEASSMLVGRVGGLAERTIGFNPADNELFSLLAIITTAERIQMVVKKGLLKTKDVAPLLASARESLRSILTVGKMRSAANALIVEAKALSWLPKTLFSFRHGAVTYNIYNTLFETRTRELFGEGISQKMGLLSFFAPQIVGEWLSGGYLNLFFSTGFLGKAVPYVQFLAGFGMAYGGTINAARHLYFGAQGNYHLGIAYETAEQMRKLDRTQWIVEFLMGKDLVANIYAGDNVLGVLFDGYQWLYSDAIGTLDKTRTAAYIRRRVYAENLKIAGEETERIRDLLVSYAAIPVFEGTERPTAKEWKRIICSGWLERVDKSIFSNVGNLPREAIKMIVNIAYLIEAPSAPLRKFFAPELQIDQTELDKMFTSDVAKLRLTKPGMENDVLNWVGGENVILMKRQRIFMKELITAKLKNDAEMTKVGIDAGYMEKDGTFTNIPLYLSVIHSYVESSMEFGGAADIRDVQEYAKASLENAIEAKRTGDACKAAYYFANILVMDPERLFGYENWFVKGYQNIMIRDNEKFVGFYGSAYKEIAEKIERSVADDIAEHLLIAKELGAAPLEGASYNEKEITSKLAQALRLRRLSDSISEAGELLKLYEYRGALDDRGAVIAAVWGNVQKISMSEWYTADKKEMEERVKNIEPPLKTGLAVLWLLSENEAVDGLNRPSADELFLEVLDKHKELGKRIAETAFYWKKAGKDGPIFGGAITEDGRVGDLKVLKAWIRHDVANLRSKI